MNTNDYSRTRDNQPMPAKYDPAKTEKLLKTWTVYHAVRLVDQLAACDAECAGLEQRLANEIAACKSWFDRSEELVNENERLTAELAKLNAKNEKWRQENHRPPIDQEIARLAAENDRLKAEIKLSDLYLVSERDRADRLFSGPRIDR